MTRRKWIKSWLLFGMVLLWHAPAFSQAQQPVMPETKGTIRGRVAGWEETKTGGMVAFFDVREGPPSGQGDIRRVPNALAKFDAQGFFSVGLPEGRYYIGVVPGRPPRTVGPPRETERSFTAHDQDGNLKIFVVKKGKTLETGDLSGKVPVGGQGVDQPVFTVKGVIRDEAGKQMAGAKVIAFKVGDPTRRPVAIAQARDKDGAYQLNLPAEASFTISVRADYGGGKPATGEYIGRYGGRDMIPVTGKKDEVLNNYDITVFLVPERLPKGEVASPSRKQQPGSAKEPGTRSEAAPK